MTRLVLLIFSLRHGARCNDQHTSIPTDGFGNDGSFSWPPSVRRRGAWQSSIFTDRCWFRSSMMLVYHWTEQDATSNAPSSASCSSSFFVRIAHFLASMPRADTTSANISDRHDGCCVVYHDYATNSCLSCFMLRFTISRIINFLWASFDYLSLRILPRSPF